MPAIVSDDRPTVVTGAVIGHRGAAGLAPENTLAGFAKARQLGCTWVEIDAKPTRDGVVILMHDDTLNRTTNGTGAVAEADLAAIRALDAGGWFSPETVGERVPTLIEALTFAANLNLGVNVEIKPCPGREAVAAETVLDILADWTAAPVLVSSFDPAAIARTAEVCPHLPRALLVTSRNLDGADERALAMGCEGLHVNEASMTAERIAALTARGLRVRCYTVNSRERADALLAWGAEAVFSDFPDRVRGD